MSTTAPEKENTRAEAVNAQGRTFCWHQIFAGTEQASMEFYTKALGWGTAEFPLGEMGTYKMLTVDGIPVAGVVPTENNACADLSNVPPHWSVSISTDDIAARIKSCTDNGATILNDVSEIPTVGKMALIQDPQGATFWLFEPAGNC